MLQRLYESTFWASFTYPVVVVVLNREIGPLATVAYAPDTDATNYTYITKNKYVNCSGQILKIWISTGKLYIDIT